MYTYLYIVVYTHIYICIYIYNCTDICVSNIKKGYLRCDKQGLLGFVTHLPYDYHSIPEKLHPIAGTLPQLCRTIARGQRCRRGMRGWVEVSHGSNISRDITRE